MSSAPRTARDRVRAELTGEILATARGHLARDGASGLSLRAIARDLGMAPSALYRYYDGRDALLTALILSAYSSLADAVEGLTHTAWPAVPLAIRRWAVAHPHEWGLVFGTPVPGYDAPQETVEHYARIAAALAAPLVAIVEARGAAEVPAETVAPELVAAVDPVASGMFATLPTAVVLQFLGAWTTVVGTISLEIFGHWRNTVLDPEVFFADEMARLGAAFGV